MEWVRDEGSLSVEFEAEDPVKRAAVEADLRARLPHHPPPPKSKASTPRFALGCAGLIAILFGSCLVRLHGHVGLKIVGALIIVATVVLLSAVESRSRAEAAPVLREVTLPPVPEVTSRFTLTLTPATLTLSADGRVVRTVPLADIADVVVAERVELVRGDGSRTDLPITRVSFVNEEMAAELRAGIREMRSVQTDYRGTPTKPAS